MCRLACVSVLVVMLCAGSARGATLHVPQDFPTVQKAINASVDGDEIILAPGIYEETLEIHKAIRLRSTFNGYDWSIVESTVIRPSNEYINIPAIQVQADRNATIRGIRVTRPPQPVPPPLNGTRSIGIAGDANVEYCIIENQDNRPKTDGGGGGGAIAASNGIINGNILRNNKANSGGALFGCGGRISNNLIYDSRLYAITACNGEIVNNTLYNNGAGFSTCTGVITNNIVWRTIQSTLPSMAASSTPTRCLLIDYSGPGEGNIDADPLFVDPDNEDFRLRPDSPCIDSGKAIAGVKADFYGVQRGLMGKSAGAGDGSKVDIGAVEFVPKPVGVWLPNGGPDLIRSGDYLKVAWELDLNTAGSAIRLELRAGENGVADLGAFWNAGGADRPMVKIPRGLMAGGEYFIRGFSAYDAGLWSDTPLFEIDRTGTGTDRGWMRYR